MLRRAEEGISRGRIRVPAGAPAWITTQLIAETLQAWQPHYKRPLTAADAFEILLDTGRLMDLLEEVDDESISGAGTCVEP